MAWRQHGRAKVDRTQPQAWGECDRCGFVYNLVDLRYQFEWAGPRLQNTRFKVCYRCYDTPFEHFRPIIIPPDPIPVYDPRPGNPQAQMGGGQPTGFQPGSPGLAYDFTLQQNALLLAGMPP